MDWKMRLFRHCYIPTAAAATGGFGEKAKKKTVLLNNGQAVSDGPKKSQEKIPGKKSQGQPACLPVSPGTTRPSGPCSD
jgi:hypothetical protein